MRFDTATAPSAAELRRELADANANCVAADRLAAGPKDIADKAEMLRLERATPSSAFRLVLMLRSVPPLTSREGHRAQ